MIELKNKEGEVGCLHKYEDIKDIRKEKITENIGDITEPTKSRWGLVVEFNNGKYIECFNTMEDIQAQIRAIKGIVVVNGEEFENMQEVKFEGFDNIGADTEHQAFWNGVGKKPIIKFYNDLEDLKKYMESDEHKEDVKRNIVLSAMRSHLTTELEDLPTTPQSRILRNDKETTS